MKQLENRELETERLFLHITEENIKIIEERLDSRVTILYCWMIELKSMSRAIGQIVVLDNPKNGQEDVVDVKCFIDTPYQNNGYAYEASLEVLKFMFLEVEIRSIETSIFKDHISGWKLLEKLGFQRFHTADDVDGNVFLYECHKKDFLKELFRKERLYITEDIDKDPFIMHLNDYPVLNITGVSGSGKSSTLEKYMNDSNYIVIDTDIFYSDLEYNDSNMIKIRNYFVEKNGSLPNLYEGFDTFYQGVIDCFFNDGKYLIIDSSLFCYMKDLSLLKGDIIILRTCVNNCYHRCIQKFQTQFSEASFEELSEYQNDCKKIYKEYHSINQLIDRIDRMEGV